MPHEIGPRAKISFIMLLAPDSEPYSAMVAFGYESNATHLPPSAVNVLHVRATLMGLHVQSADAQKPSVDS